MNDAWICILIVKSKQNKKKSTKATFTLEDSTLATTTTTKAQDMAIF